MQGSLWLTEYKREGEGGGGAAESWGRFHGHRGDWDGSGKEVHDLAGSGEDTAGVGAPGRVSIKLSRWLDMWASMNKVWWEAAKE